MSVRYVFFVLIRLVFFFVFHTYHLCLANFSFSLFFFLLFFFFFYLCFIYLVPGRFLLYISARSSLALRYLLTFADFTYLKDNSVKYLSEEASRFDVWRELLWVSKGEKRTTPRSSPLKEAINFQAASCVRNMLRYTRFQLMHLYIRRRSMRNWCCCVTEEMYRCVQYFLKYHSVIS